MSVSQRAFRLIPFFVLKLRAVTAAMFFLKLRQILPCLTLAPLLLSGCGVENVANTTSTPPASLNLAAGHTQQWVEQLQNQTLTSVCPTATSCSPTNQVAGIATDAQNNIYIDGNALTDMPGITDLPFGGVFASKYDSNGNLLWTQEFAPATSFGYAEASSIAVDSEGDTYVGGLITGDFPDYPVDAAQLKLMLVKIDPNGHILSEQQYNTNLFLFLITGESMTLLPNGQVAFGWTSASTTTGDENQSFLYVVDPNTSTAIWQKSYLGSNDLQALTSDAEGNLYATGVSLGAFPGMSYLPGTTTQPSPVPFALKVQSGTGEILWQQNFSTYLAANPSNTQFNSIALDSAGNVILGGATTSPQNLLCSGLCDIPSAQGQGAIVAKIDGQTGNSLWTKSFTTGYGDGVEDVTTDASGNSFAVGFTNGAMSSVFSQPIDNLFALKLDANGDPIWVQQFGTGPWQNLLPPTIGLRGTTDLAGDLVIGGETEGAFPGISNPTQLGEAFVIKFGP